MYVNVFLLVIYVCFELITFPYIHSLLFRGWRLWGIDYLIVLLDE